MQRTGHWKHADHRSVVDLEIESVKIQKTAGLREVRKKSLPHGDGVCLTWGRQLEQKADDRGEIKVLRIKDF